MKIYKLGLDVGSTTAKIALLDENNNLVFEKYQRHFSNIKETITLLIKEIFEIFGNINVTSMITGSGGVSLSEIADIAFIQEVVAVSTAINTFERATDVAIEIGGEDAKIIYFTNGIEQRMNGICAGGTGSFIDQMATLLQTDATGLNEFAKDYKIIYPIAGRCGVFAKSDIQPLINEGASKPDLAVSIFQAIVTQTISGLACGKPIRGKVAFLGGPLHFLSELRNRFVDVLSLSENEIIIPKNSHLFAALGSAITSSNLDSIPIDTLIYKLENNNHRVDEISNMQPLFESKEQYAQFKERHSKATVPKTDLENYKGDAFLGIDAGSTTTKLALIGEDGSLLYSYYSSNKGNPIATITSALIQIYNKLPTQVKIKGSCVTGYGEALIKSAFNIDLGEVETIAHYKGASFFQPDVDFILDIGGQDMKCIRIKNGFIDNIVLNEACSAGCGSFIESFAKDDITSFVNNSLFAESPTDLGSRCTVFMNSKIKQVQKEGASLPDISAGLSYSIIKNALQKVIKISSPEEMGKSIVVQGGTFYNDAVLRSFELISERDAIRPDISGIMGAFGAALLAKENCFGEYQSTLIDLEQLKLLSVEQTFSRCKRCSNNCLLTINNFTGNRKFISGNRCEKGLGNDKKDNNLPNLFKYKLERLFSYTPLCDEKATRGIVGIPRVLNVYENYPFWFTFFTHLKYRVMLSPQSTHKIYEKGIESIPSESACYPAKIVHGHISSLIEKGAKYIFYPCVAYERKDILYADDSFNCPIVTSYPENIKNNVEELYEKHIHFHNPFLSFNDKVALTKRLIEEFPNISRAEIINALEKAWIEQDNFRTDIKNKGEETLRYIEEHKIPGMVLAGRPYHLDHEINHGIPDLITSYGYAVLTEDSVAHLSKGTKHISVRNQWAYHSRLYECATFVAMNKNLQLIQLTSFGCGLDSVATDEVSDILQRNGKTYTLIKIDEVNNLGAVKIRIRSLFATLEQRKKLNNNEDLDCTNSLVEREKRIIFTKQMRKTHTLLCPQLSPIHFQFIKEAFISCDYNIVLMGDDDKKCIDTGLKYVNNDACYPAIIVVGQLLDALKSGNHDVNNTSILISQTGGGCRASNYINFIRKALKKAEFSQVPVISLSASGIEKNPGFKITLELLNRAVQGIIYGDLFIRVLYKVRPYEKVKGSANALYDKWRQKCAVDVRSGDFITFKDNIKNIVKDFDTLEITDVKKPKVGLVGEILVKFHPIANNDIISMLEKEGAEVVVPDLMDFFLYSFYNSTYKEKYFGGKKINKLISDGVIASIELYRKHLKKSLEQSTRFDPPSNIKELASLAEPIVSLGNQTGEGWFLTAEMVELIHSGVNNIVCMQPFACLPNHVTGKGIIKQLRRKYPLSNIVPIDYDPGASEVNQINRIKLMLSQAERNMNTKIVYKKQNDTYAIQKENPIRV